jgi:hypothetical protein
MAAAEICFSKVITKEKEMNQVNNRPDSFENNQSIEPRGRSGGRSTFDQVKSTVASKLQGAADTLREKSGQAGSNRQGLASYGNQAANWLNRSADYINDLNPDQLKDDVKNQVRTHPGRSLLIAGAAGLILGAILRRR